MSTSPVCLSFNLSLLRLMYKQRYEINVSDISSYLSYYLGFGVFLFFRNLEAGSFICYYANCTVSLLVNEHKLLFFESKCLFYRCLQSLSN